VKGFTMNSYKNNIRPVKKKEVYASGQIKNTGCRPLLPVPAWR
jgi:hypothetical protein